MEWNRSEVIALAKQSCTTCKGTGVRSYKGSSINPCNCVYRMIFRACYARFRYCATKEKYMSKVTLDFSSGRDRRRSYGRKDEEYVADFYLIAKRELDEAEFKVFRYHFLLGADWKLCCRQMKVDRGTFFHSVYRIQQKLGKAFREIEPYGLFPLDEYFGGKVEKGSKTEASLAPNVVAFRPLQPPVRRAA